MIAWSPIAAPAGHRLATFDGSRSRCSCSWSTRASTLQAARAAVARHVELAELLAKGAR